MLVSILIPCFNAERWVAQAIESALGQSWPEKEVIVVDDGSEDGSLDVIKSFGKRIRWETGPNLGGNVARNRLLGLAKGKWLQYLDADDYLLPPKIERQMEFLLRHPDCDVVYSPVLFESWSTEALCRKVTAIPEPRDPWILLARWYLPQTGGALWRSSALMKVHGWKPDQPCCQEHELYLRLLQSGAEFCYFGECHATYCYRPCVATVSERNRGEVRRRRLEISARMEEFLRMRGELTPSRLQALNQARFEIARMAWPEDHALAREIVEEIEQSEPGFVPGPPAARRTYRWMYRLFGLDTAERVAGCKRRLRRQTARLLSDTDIRMLS